MNPITAGSLLIYQVALDSSLGFSKTKIFKCL